MEDIPQSKKSLEIAVPLWNKECDVALKKKKLAFYRMKRTWLLSDTIIFKRCRVKARSVVPEQGWPTCGACAISSSFDA